MSYPFGGGLASMGRLWQTRQCELLEKRGRQTSAPNAWEQAMKQAFLAAGLIAAAVGVFVAGRMLMPGAVAETASLGDLTAMQAIVTDVAAIAKTGDLKAAEVRVGDLETAWDDAQPVMRPKNPEAWGRVDDAADKAFKALRSATPDAPAVDAALVTLAATLADPGAGVATAGGVVMIGSIPVTDAAGHPLPCEAMLAEVNTKLAATTMTPEAGAAIADLIAKATERCNADDDRNADAFSAQALQMLVAG